MGSRGCTTQRHRRKYFLANLQYGNHKTMDIKPKFAYESLLKESKRGYYLVLTHLWFSVLSIAMSHQSVSSELINSTKKPRPIFDSSFRPKPMVSGINVRTTKTTEPPMHFAASFMKYLEWIFNLKITYSTKWNYLGNDDISGAFRHMNYNSNLVGMNSCVIAGHLACSTGMTFGDNTSPSNFAPIADARRQLAKYLWEKSDTISKTTKFLSAIKLAPPPTSEIRALRPRRRRLDEKGSA